MTSAAIYTRISQDRDGDALGVKRQEADCRALARDKGWAVADVYQDNDVSATSSKPRPEYVRLLADVESRRIDALVVWDVDRLARKPRELEDVIDLFERFGVSLASVGGEIDLATPQGRLIARVKGVVARHEADQTSRRAKAKHAERAAQGLPPGGGLRPYGFEEDRITHSSAEARVVLEAFQMLRNGSSLRAICRLLNERGDLTVTGKFWATSNLKKMLLGPRVAGFRQHNGELIDAVWAPIVDREQWAQLRRERGVDGSAGTQASPRTHTWTGLLTCWRCGGLLGGRKVNGTPTYVCRSSTHTKWDANRKGGCQGTSVRQSFTELLLDDLLLSRVEEESLGDVRVGTDTRDLEAEITALDARLLAVAKSYSAGDIDSEAYRVASRTITDRLGAVRHDLAKRHTSSRTRAQLDPGTIRSRWPSMPPGEKRSLARAFVERVEVGPARRGDNRFDPERLRVAWL